MAIKLTADQVFPPDGKAILAGTRPNSIYAEDGTLTGRTDGIRCDCRTLPDLASVSVKVLGATAPMSNEELERRALDGNLTWVEFENFLGTQWLDRRSNQIRVSGTATGIKIVPAPGIGDLLDIQ